MKSRVSGVMKAAACLTVIGAILGLMQGEARAQVRPAYTKNVDEPGRVPFQQMIEFGPGAPHCPLSQFCLLSFGAVPPGKRLVVESVTVMIGVATPGYPNLIAFGDGTVSNGGNVAIIQPIFTAGLSVAGVTFWNLDKPVRVYFEPAATPKLKIATTAIVAFVGNASIHGYLIDAVN